jgi:hypothetical protein
MQVSGGSNIGFVSQISPFAREFASFGKNRMRFRDSSLGSFRNFLHLTNRQPCRGGITWLRFAKYFQRSDLVGSSESGRVSRDVAKEAKAKRVRFAVAAVYDRRSAKARMYRPLWNWCLRCSRGLRTGSASFFHIITAWRPGSPLRRTSRLMRYQKA